MECFNIFVNTENSFTTNLLINSIFFSLGSVCILSGLVQNYAIVIFS